MINARLITGAAVVGLMAGCTPMDAIKAVLPSNDGITVDTEIVAGDKEQEVKVTGKSEKTENKAETITQTYTTVNESPALWLYLLGLIGWLLPSPRQMWLYFRR